MLTIASDGIIAGTLAVAAILATTTSRDHVSSIKAAAKLKSSEGTTSFDRANLRSRSSLIDDVFAMDRSRLLQHFTPMGVTMSVLEEVLQANAAYFSDFGDKASLALPPARRFAILTCMDARLDPAKYAGLAEGDAHVIRNAGGRATDDAIRSLVISYKLLGTREWFVVHHTDCGMQLFTDEIIGDLLERSLETATVDETGWHDPGHGPGSVQGRYVKWHTFKDLEASVREDVSRLRTHPLVPSQIPIYGYVYDVHTGRLIPVA